MYVTTPSTPPAYAAGGGVIPASVFAPYVGMNGLGALDLMVVGGLGSAPPAPSAAALLVEAVVPLALIGGMLWLGSRAL